MLDALADTRVVFIAGARQTGKSTLARQIAGSEGRQLVELSLDRRQTREGAIADPEGFIAGLRGPAFIDEVGYFDYSRRRPQMSSPTAASPPSSTSATTPSASTSDCCKRSS